MATPRLRLGQLLVDAKLISAEALEQVLREQRSDGRRLGTLLVERGLINETQLTQILSHQLSVPWVSLLHIEFSRQLLNLVPYDVADRYCLLPIYVRHVRGQGDTLYVAMDDPSNEDGLAACREHAGLPVRAMIAPPQDIRNAIRVYYGVKPATPSVVEPPAAEPAPLPVAPAPPPIEPPLPTEPPPTLASSERAAPDESAAREATFAAAPVSETASPAEAASPEEAAPAALLPDELEARLSAVSAPVEEPVPLVTRSARPSTSRPADAPDHADAPRTEPDPAPRSAPASSPPGSSRSPAERLRALLSAQPAPPPAVDEPVENIPRPRGRTPRMVALTLLDGTTITLPAKRRRPPTTPPPEVESPEPAPPPDERPVRSEPPGPDELHGLTARDLVTALRAVSHGADASEVLGTNVRWEAMFAALLSLMLKKHLIADWEFVEELKKF
jgi:type IV pilus assembly protein PilB